MTPGHETRQEVGGWVVEFLTMVGREDLLDVIIVEWNSRFTRRMGDATYHASALSRSEPPKVARVRFSTPLWAVAPKEEQRNTVAHEVAHLVVFHEWYLDNAPKRFGELPGRGRKPSHHGYEWKSMMYRMGETPSRCHNVRLPQETKPEPRTFHGFIIDHLSEEEFNELKTAYAS